MHNNILINTIHLKGTMVATGSLLNIGQQPTGDSVQQTSLIIVIIVVGSRDKIVHAK